MKRSDFLAIIPSLSALPFIGKEIIKKSDRIEIYQPEQMRQAIHGNECEVHVVKEGRILAKGWIETVQVTRDTIDTSCRDNGGARTYSHVGWECTAQVHFNGPITSEAINAMHDITSNSVRHLISSV